MVLANYWKAGHKKIADDAINKIKKNWGKRPSSLPILPSNTL